MCKILFMQPNLVAFSCYTASIHLEKWLMRCDTKRAIWRDLYKKHISTFCIKHMIWFHFDCIMQLKKSYHTANVCCRKSAITVWWYPWLLSVQLTKDSIGGHSITKTSHISQHNNIKTSSYKYRDHHYQDKTVSRPSCLYNGNNHTWKDRLYIQMGRCPGWLVKNGYYPGL